MIDNLRADDWVRCGWAGISDSEYARYHDEEWGIPVADDRRLFEKLVLEGFQAGLSWLTILKKRDAFREAFHGFDAARVAAMKPKDVERLMQDACIVRNRAKIDATITNARAYLSLAERQSLASFVWSFVGGRPIVNAQDSRASVPASTDISVAISKALKREGFRFVGPTTVYAFMQSVGMVNDHVTACHRYQPCASLQKRFEAPKQ